VRPTRPEHERSTPPRPDAHTVRARLQPVIGEARRGGELFAAGPRPTLPGPPSAAAQKARRIIDYRIYHAINRFVSDHAWLGTDLAVLEKWAVPVVAVATFALWLLARPGGDRKWKLASSSALAAAALGLLVNQLIGKLWHRPRPFATHPSAHVWGSRSHDPSFPSDHASAAYAIAFAIFLYDRLVGSVFLAAATVIAVGRVFIGAHYPADVAAGLLVGLACALLVARLAGPLLVQLVRRTERITDPLLSPLWRLRNTALGSRR
jgi:undecaprenyl-diphosphatase